MTTDLLEYIIHYIKQAWGDGTVVHLKFIGPTSFACVVLGPREIVFGEEQTPDPINYPGVSLVDAVHKALAAAMELTARRKGAAA